MDDRERELEEEIVIVGGGICGLATALALHRKGIRSVVLERSETLRASGGGIGILANGWRALHQLGVASRLRQTALPLRGARDIWVEQGSSRETQLGIGEARCLRRSELIKTLADALPPNTIRFGCQVVSVKLHPSTSYPILHLQDGNSIVAKVLIGCDGASSVVARFLNLKPTREFSRCAVRGMTNYPNGHGFSHELLRMRRNNLLLGRVPIDNVSAFWFVALEISPEDAKVWHKELIKQFILQSINGFPEDIIQMIERSDMELLSLTHVRYRAPWDLLRGKFRKGTVTVAGDAMHAMGPFLGQGGSAGLEDAIVLARCLSQKLSFVDPIKDEKHLTMQHAEEAMDEYLKERTIRVFLLSTQTYLVGLLLQSSSKLVKFVSIFLMIILFTNPNKHSRYDCGPL